MEPISRIDPSTNQLFFRGINAIDLASTSDFESVLFLLINGKLPTAPQRIDLIQKMNSFRSFYSKGLKSLDDLINQLNRFSRQSKLTLHDTLLAFVTLCPIVIANQFKQSKTKQPNLKINHAANFLWMTRGKVPSKQDFQDFQTSLILPMDDPDNPSLSALIESLEKNDYTEALLAALKKHIGPLHHGAGALAMKMYSEIKAPAKVRDYLKEKLKEGEKIYGLGHRIYTGLDPRASVLRSMLRKRTVETSNEWLYNVSEEIAREGRSLLLEYKGINAYPNIDLYNAAVYFTFGFPPELNTSLFAISRSAGWMAHILDHSKKL